MSQQFRVYTDVEDLLINGTVTVETASLVGGNSTIASPITAGALSVSATPQSSYPFPDTATFTMWMLDGQNAETVTATQTAPGSNTFTLASPGTVYAHAAGVNISSAGSFGCLAYLIKECSGVVESICRQGPDGAPSRSLYQQTWTEKLSGPNWQRANFDVDGTLLLHPYRFPIVSASNVTVQMGNTTALTIDLSFLMIADAARYLAIPTAQTINTNPPQPSPWWPYFNRNARFVANLTYVGGPVPGLSLDNVQSEIRRACTYLVMDRLGQRRNPLGAASMRQGDFQFEARLRGDTTGRSLFRIDAEALLEPFSQKR